MTPSHHIRRIFSAHLLAGLWLVGCTPEHGVSRAGDSDRAPHAVAASVADTDVVRAIGVPNDPDDTLPTLSTKSAYGKREAPRPLSPPQCGTGSSAVCVADTARTVFSVACCIGDQRITNWLIFAARGDSMQIFSSEGPRSMATMSRASPPGSWKEGIRGVDGSWIRFHFPDAGTYVFEEMIESDTSLAYELRVIPVVATGATRITGGKAELVVTADTLAKVAIVPVSLVRSLSPSAVHPWAVSPGRYAALLVRDTTYAACKLPCTSFEMFTMKAGQHVTLTFGGR